MARRIDKAPPLSTHATMPRGRDTKIPIPVWLCEVSIEGEPADVAHIVNARLFYPGC
jgi:hypothetical protein